MLTCKQIEAQLNEYMENSLSQEDMEACQQHISTCEHCQNELEDLLLMKEVMMEMPLRPLPDGFSSTLHEKLLQVQEDEAKVVPLSKFKKVWNDKRTWQWTSFAAAACLILTIGVQNLKLDDTSLLMTNNAPQSSADLATSDGSAGTESAVTAPITYDTAAPSPSPEAPNAKVQATFGTRSMGSSTDSLQQPVTVSSRQLIYNGTINIEVPSQDETIKRIKEYLSGIQGYVENSAFGENPVMLDSKSSTSQKYGNLVLRIPAQQFEDAYAFVKSQGKVTNESEYVTDVTQVITDLEAALKNLKVREESLRGLLKQAKTIAEIMSVDKEISAVRTEIDQLTSQLKQNQDAVQMSTLSVNIIETVSVSESLKSEGSFIERAIKGLDQTVQYTLYYITEGLLLIIAFAPIWIVVIPLGILGIWFLRKKRMK